MSSIVIQCQACGTGLMVSGSVLFPSDNALLSVSPCPKCNYENPTQAELSARGDDLTRRRAAMQEKLEEYRKDKFELIESRNKLIELVHDMIETIEKAEVRQGHVVVLRNGITYEWKARQQNATFGEKKA